jgi:hypothetical protein
MGRIPTCDGARRNLGPANLLEWPSFCSASFFCGALGAAERRAAGTWGTWEFSDISVAARSTWHFHKRTGTSRLVFPPPVRTKESRLIFSCGIAGFLVAVAIANCMRFLNNFDSQLFTSFAILCTFPHHNRAERVHKIQTGLLFPLDVDCFRERGTLRDCRGCSSRASMETVAQ